jgi:hypothetical protein
VSEPVVEVTGAEQLERVAAALVGQSKQLRLEFLAGLREAMKPLKAAVIQSARDNLPHSGGLAETIAGSKFGIRTRVTPSSASLQLRAVGGYDKHSSRLNIKRMDTGSLRHPVFGGTTWVTQKITPGWFSNPTRDARPEIIAKAHLTADAIAAKIEAEAEL